MDREQVAENRGMVAGCKGEITDPGMMAPFVRSEMTAGIMAATTNPIMVAVLSITEIVSHQLTGSPRLPSENSQLLAEGRMQDSNGNPVMGTVRLITGTVVADAEEDFKV